ncbi:MAG: Na+/H+ antiporter NhaC family protein, partial [Dehalobacterium sp.]
HIEKEECERIDGAEYPDKSQNLIIPVAVLLVSTLFFFWWTGKEHSSTFWGAFSMAKYNVSILTGALFTLFFTSIFFLLQGISLAEIDAHIAKGGEKVLSLVIILILSWALTLVTQELGFNSLFQSGFISHMPKFLIPAGIFLISAVIAYTVGSSWATWALVMPLAITFAVNYEISPALLVGTVWSGGAVADIISPLSAQVADISFGRHLITTFPYLIAGVVFTVLGYLMVGLTLLN